MRAYIITGFGEEGTVADVPTPEPDEGQILVWVKAASVNAMDAVVANGYLKDFMEHRFPLVLGFDYAGSVAALGSGVSGLAIGDEVFGAVGKMHVGEGSFAEYATASAALAIRRPDSLPVEVAAALPLAGGEALAEIEAADIGAGDTVLIVGAGGGVGAFATQLAAHRGARVIAVTSVDKADWVRDLGAAEVLDYAATDLVEQVGRLAPDGVSAFIDHFDDAAGLVPLAGLVRSGGHVVSPVAMGAEKALSGLPLTFHFVQAAVERAAELGDLASRGTLRVAVETSPLERAGEALARQATRQIRGKLVVVME